MLYFFPANSRLSPRVSRAVDRYFTDLGQGCNPGAMVPTRVHQIARLDALPDAALTAMGLTREGIPRYVFRDIFPG
jgi:hypothetical protein